MPRAFPGGPHRGADLLTVRESTVRDYARRGVVPSVKIGRHLRFVEDDLAAFVEGLRHLGGRVGRPGW